MLSPRGLAGKEYTHQCRRKQEIRFSPWVGKIPGGGHCNPLHYSCLRIPWTEEPSGLLSMGSHRVRRDWAAKLSCITSTYTTASLILNSPFVLVSLPRRVYGAFHFFCMYEKVWLLSLDLIISLLNIKVVAHFFPIFFPTSFVSITPPPPPPGLTYWTSSLPMVLFFFFHLLFVIVDVDWFCNE